MKHQKKVVLMILAIIISLIMVSLGFWQLDRADQKRQILSQQFAQSKLTAIKLGQLLDEVVDDYQALRFRKVIARGTFLEEQTIYIDNQVYKSKVGYRLITPFSFYKSNEIESQRVVLVDRGWLPAGVSRTILPNVDTVEGILTINGRLNLPFQKPPIWDDKYPVFDGDVWQFLPIDKFSEQTGLDVLPLVLELAAPEKVTNDSSDVLVPIVDWATINNEWVQKHQAYALQWFSMSLVFFIACLVVLIKSLRVNPEL